MVRLLGLAAILATSALAQTLASCGDGGYGGTFTLRRDAHDDSDPTINVGIIPNVRAPGLDGHLDSILVTKYKNGTAIAPQTWELDGCSDQQNDALPPGYTPPNVPYNLAFGILRPAGDTKRCVTLSTPIYNTTGARNILLLAEDCALVDAKYRTFMLESLPYSETYYYKLFFAFADDTAKITSSPHGEVIMVTNDVRPDDAAMRLELNDEF